MDINEQIQEEVQAEYIEPVLTQEQMDEAEIRQQSDCFFNVVRSGDAIDSIVCTVLGSEILNKKVVSIYHYIEEIENNTVVGRLQQSVEKQSMTINEPLELSQLVIDCTRPAERGATNG